MRRGASLDELWKVARGEVKYGDFISKQKGGREQKPAKRTSKQSTKVPEELVPPLGSQNKACGVAAKACFLLMQLGRGTFVKKQNKRSNEGKNGTGFPFSSTGVASEWDSAAVDYDL